MNDFEVTIREMCELAKIDRWTARQWCRSGQVAAIKNVSGNWLASRSDLEEFIATHKHGSWKLSKEQVSTILDLAGKYSYPEIADEIGDITSAAVGYHVRKHRKEQ